MSKSIPDLRKVFAAAALRPTAQRYAVLEYLAESEVHATAEEILFAVNRRDPRASRATIYNSLHSLAKAGLVREVLSDGKAARFDANLHKHHHFICERCGAVDDIPWFEVPPAPRLAALRGRAVRSYEIVFRGACEACRESLTAPAEPRRSARAKRGMRQ